MSENRLTVERLPSVLARVGRSRASLYRDIAAGQFPSPVKIGERAIGWDPRVVDNWSPLKNPLQAPSVIGDSGTALKDGHP
ncbi:AlpA family phage regulatory protein, partial [Xanthomonas campestris pv. campestris]|nr:AlpA family phage regulatory protein [Xanthomonas campestris pv. campestris]MEB1420194.1 AlpA family phage regulatory protein [Xanthomonas campestris pv. campestris]MEB1451300.1 AlpA family phage regulatory protein [Xanthomonas campestris pv. campestris]